jgi:hypothetical protein
MNFELTISLALSNVASLNVEIMRQKAMHLRDDHK